MCVALEPPETFLATAGYAAPAPCDEEFVLRKNELGSTIASTLPCGTDVSSSKPTRQTVAFSGLLDKGNNSLHPEMSPH